MCDTRSFKLYIVIVNKVNLSGYTLHILDTHYSYTNYRLNLVLVDVTKHFEDV